MKDRLSSGLGAWLRFSPWLTALIGIVVIKVFLSLTLLPSPFLAAYSGISYFLLLLLATSVAIRNVVHNTLHSRSFWLFLAISYGLWALDQAIYLYYGLALHVDVPDNSIADPVLFLHIVPLLAAVAGQPDRRISGRKAYQAILNFLILLFFWSFLYGYAVFPYQFLFSNAVSYALRFDILYLAENLALVLALSFFALRTQPPWRAVYLHLLGAAVLYGVSSTIANIAIDSGGYVNGKLYGVGLTASVCWFVWIPLSARRLTGADVTDVESESTQDSQTSVLAMIAVLMISVPIAWEVVQIYENSRMHTLRLLVAIATIVGLASAAFIKEYLAKRELAARVGLAHDRLRLAMESSKAVGWDWDVKSGRDTWFGDLKTMFGIPSDTFVGRVDDFRHRVHPDDQDQVWKAVNDAMRGHQAYEAECRVVWPDGTVRWITNRGRFYYSERGEALRMLGMAVDITERKHAEQALRDSEDRYRDLVEHSQDLLCTHDLTGKMLSCNPAPARILGYEVAEVLKMPMREFIAPEYREKFDAYLERIKAVGSDKGMMLVMTRGGGRRIWEYHNTLRTEGVTTPIVRGMAQDVTERKRAERATQDWQKRLDLAQRAGLRIGLWDWDVSANSVTWSDESYRQFGFTRDTFSGRVEEAVDRIHPEDRPKVQKAIQTVLAGDTEMATQYRVVWPDGTICWIDAYGVVVREGPPHMLGIGIDITNLKRTEQSLQEAKIELARVARMATMGELTATIAHEINQPLAAVTTNASAAMHWLAVQPPNLEEAREALSRAIQDANRASGVIRRIRALLQHEGPQFRPLDGNELICEVVRLVESELQRGGVVLKTELASEDLILLGDRIQVQQVLLNLILNAIDAMSTVSDRGRQLLVKSSTHPDGVLIQIQDSGRGFDLELASRIFEPFFTTKPQGIGMGLSISRSIVEAHGGRLWATPGPAHGAVFNLILPEAAA